MTDTTTIIRKYEFSAKAEARLQVLMDKLCTNSSAEVLLNALQLYDWALEEIEAGKRIASIDKDGNAEVVIFTVKD